MRGAGTQHHRLGDPALLAQPPLAHPGQVGDRVLGEELAVQQLAGRLLGDRLGAVLAELGRMPVTRVGVGPGAALTVEPVDLVELGAALRRAEGTHLAHGPAHGDGHGGHSRGGGVGGVVDLEVGLVDVGLRDAPELLGHDPGQPAHPVILPRRP